MFGSALYFFFIMKMLLAWS